MLHLCSGDRAAGESDTAMNTMIQFPPRQRLIAERLRRHWTQLEVADRLGTTPGNVSRWERGITLPGPYFRHKLSELFGRSAQELGLSWEESDDAADHQAQVLALAPLFPGGTSARSNSFARANSGLSGLNLPEQENEDQVRFAQAFAQVLQASLNQVLIPANAGAMVLVVLNSNVDLRPASLHRKITPCDDCCDEYPPMQGSLRQRQGA